MTQTKAIRVPGKDRPAASQTRTQGLRRRSLTIGISVKNTKPSAISPASETAEGLDRRFLRSQPVSSALSHSAGRDPGEVSTTLTRNHGS
jgi:hypothetical protein